MNDDAALMVATDLITVFEGFRSKPYLDPVGIPTIGYGFTRYLDGTAVTLIDGPMTREAANLLLRHLIETKYMPAVRRLCPGIDTPERLGAITDFCYNLGVGALRASTLRKKINAGLWDEVPAQLMRWTKAGGKVLPGLVRRRAAEAAYV